MDKQLPKVLIAAPVHPVLTSGLAAAGYECILQEHITQNMAPALLHNCVGIITSTRLQLDKALIDTAPALQWIGRMGSGMEVIDVAYAASKGIRCFSSPEGNCNAVGEHALGMLLGLIRHIGTSQNEVKKGLWLREENRGMELEGKTLAIIGFGHTGPAFAKKLQGFDMEVLVYDNNMQDLPKPLSACDTLDRIYENAEIVSFHVPLNPGTRYYFNHAFVEKMKHPFILINTSRGGVVDTQAVYDGLISGKITGACLDVWEQEPMERMDAKTRGLLDRMVTMPNVIITPHIAGYTFDALYKMSFILLNKINNKL